jgi:serine/threonine protein kinase
LLETLSIIHSSGILHGPFHPSDIVEDEEGKVCLTNFHNATVAETVDTAACAAERRALRIMLGFEAKVITRE